MLRFSLSSRHANSQEQGVRRAASSNSESLVRQWVNSVADLGGGGGGGGGGVKAGANAPPLGGQ